MTCGGRRITTSSLFYRREWRDLHGAADHRRLFHVEWVEVNMAGEKNNGEMMATLLRMLAEMRTEGRRKDHQIQQMDRRIEQAERRLESIEAGRRGSDARMQRMDESIRKTAMILNDAAQALSEIDLRVRRLEKR